MDCISYCISSIKLLYKLRSQIPGDTFGCQRVSCAVRKHYVLPLLESHLELTIPETPNSRQQKYKTRGMKITPQLFPQEKKHKLFFFNTNFFLFSSVHPQSSPPVPGAFGAYLRFTTYDLRHTIYDIRFTTYDLRCGC